MIINSLLDTDFYKFTMGQVIFDKFRNIPVTYTFTNRTSSVPLAEIIDERELMEELDHARTLRLNNTEYHYLLGTDEYGDRMFSKEYMTFLRDLQLPPYRLERRGNQYHLTFSGPWSTTIYWETFALSIVNELYYRALRAKLSPLKREIAFSTGTLRLDRKIDEILRIKEITFSDFGTRRRFSQAWQDYIVRTLKQELPAQQFLGTSNVYLAMQHGLMPMGTSAHEMYMGMSGIMHDSDDEIRQSHNAVLQLWWEQYGQGLSIALTDTYGSEFFFNDMTAEQAANWKGLRQDSGDPSLFAQRAVDFYRRHKVNPKEKLLVFSDGLDIQTIKSLAIGLKGTIKTTFGWGTNLTNDLGYPPLSLVVKLTESNGHRTVKLSDNLAKATGTPEDIERFKQIFGYKNRHSVICTY